MLIQYKGKPGEVASFRSAADVRALELVQLQGFKRIGYKIASGLHSSMMYTAGIQHLMEQSILPEMPVVLAHNMEADLQEGAINGGERFLERREKMQRAFAHFNTHVLELTIE